jgi:hypothetical protein
MESGEKEEIYSKFPTTMRNITAIRNFEWYIFIQTSFNSKQITTPERLPRESIIPNIGKNCRSIDK